MSEPPKDPLARLRLDLGLRNLSPWWAKLEIVFGLIAAVVGVFGEIGQTVANARTGAEADWLLRVGHALLIVLGVYLALAGHRSHLYQSNNRLAAYLADLISKDHPSGTHS